MKLVPPAVDTLLLRQLVVATLCRTSRNADLVSHCTPVCCQAPQELYAKLGQLHSTAGHSSAWLTESS